MRCTRDKQSQWALFQPSVLRAGLVSQAQGLVAGGLYRAHMNLQGLQRPETLGRHDSRLKSKIARVDQSGVVRPFLQRPHERVYERVYERADPAS